MKIVKSSRIEYAKYYVNFAMGCPGGCTYCWAKKMNIRFGNVKDDDEWRRFRIREDFDKFPRYFKSDLDQIEEGAEIWIGNSFDPCHPRILPYTKRLLEVVGDHDKFVVIRLLTKYSTVTRLIPLLKRLGNRVLVGLSITTLDDRVRRRQEPYTSSAENRVRALDKLITEGIPTWISAEPVLKGWNVLEFLTRYAFNETVKQIVIGKLNYEKEEPYSDDTYLSWVAWARGINILIGHDKVHVKKEHIKYLQKRVKIMTEIEDGGENKPSNVYMRRIQISGRRLVPPSAKYVARPSSWGNPFRLKKHGGKYERAEAIERYREHVIKKLKNDPTWLDPLKGHDLACFCSIHEDCHADILFEQLVLQDRDPLLKQWFRDAILLLLHQETVVYQAMHVSTTRVEQLLRWRFHVGTTTELVSSILNELHEEGLVNVNSTVGWFLTEKGCAEVTKINTRKEAFFT